MQNIIQAIDNEVEIIKQQMDEIWGEWIVRYCENEIGEPIRCYSEAHEAAHENGEIFLCNMWDLMQTKVDKLENVCNELCEIDKI